jgi:YlmC/YmxH family sporulation protein
MELTFVELRAKDVINTQDGRKLGRVCDVALCYPENKWIGIIVPSSKGVFKKEELFIEMKNIVKVGEDVILVNVGLPKKPKTDKNMRSAPMCPPPCDFSGGARNFDEME